MTGRTAVSLFAGVGGFDLALERNGYNVVASVEIDKNARGVLEKRFPNAQLFEDVRKVTGNELKSAGFIPDGGIITGGFPCQDLSVAGKRLGFGGERSSLFYEIARLAEETKAEWLVLENVPGLLTSQRGADMGAVVGTLVELGYGVSWRVLDAQHFGVPQRRRRVFIVARRAGDVTSCAKVLFERTSLRGNPAPSGASWQETAGGAAQRTIGPLTSTGMSRARGTETVESGHYVTGTEVAGSLTAAGIRCDLNKAVAGHLAVEPVSLYEPHHGDGRVTVDRDNTLNARMGTGGNNLPVLVEPVAFDEMNFTTTPIHQTLRAGTPQSTGVVEPANGGELMNCLTAQLYHKGTMVNQDVNNGMMLIQRSPG